MGTDGTEGVGLASETKDDSVLVSILMPVFSQASYVCEAIGSAQSQTYPNIEILVHDDGSTDGTPEIVRELAGCDPRIQFTRAQSNQGVAAARNVLIEHARGHYICWLDGDDNMLPDKVRAQRAFLEENPAVVAIGQTFLGSKRWAKNGRRENFIPDLVPASIMYRGTVLRQIYPLRPLKSGEDIDLVLRVAEFGEISQTSEVLYSHRYHDGQMSRSAGSGYIIAIASNIYRTLGLGVVIAGPEIDEAAILRRMLDDRHILFGAIDEERNDTGNAGSERRFALVLVLLHAVRRIGTLGDRLAVLAGCLRHAPWALVQVVHYWLKRRLRTRSQYP